MDYNFKVVKPNAVDFSLEMTMNLQNWRKLKEQLGGKVVVFYPASYLVEAIREMVTKAEQEFLPQKKKKK